MKLNVVNSGSSGNTIVLQNEVEALVLDAGEPYKDVMRMLDYNVMKIVGVCVTHSHLDHSRYAKEYVKQGFDVFKPYESFEKKKRFGGFTVLPFECKHNVPCFGFHITHKELGSLIYATDTCYVKYKFPNVNHLLVECNYDKEIVDRLQAKFLHELNDHMELQTCLDFINANNTDALKSVLLCHGSMTSLDWDGAVLRAKNIVNCPVRFADKGVEYEL